jgi:hypothetical protein
VRQLIQKADDDCRRNAPLSPAAAATIILDADADADADAARPRRFLVRSSCCLFYRVPGSGTCGDCVLTPERARREQWPAPLSR